MLSALYGAAASWRRQWYSRHPERRRRLNRPVISVGNLSVGGSGKTPVVEYVARLLIARGERPAVLSRGYGRRLSSVGATVVSDGTNRVATVESAGDEPLMLARAVDGLIVVVGADRHLSGCLAEDQLGATVHILDDGFQHLELARDADLLLVNEDDLHDAPIPSGRLRETIGTAANADAVIVDSPDRATVERVAGALGVDPAFGMTRSIGSPRLLGGRRADVSRDGRVFAVAGIARPDRFAESLAAAGWNLAGTMWFRDHHRYDRRDIDQIVAAAVAAGAHAVLTTEKDASRLDVSSITSLPFAAIPLAVTVEPAPAFGDWLETRLRTGPRPGATTA